MRKNGWRSGNLMTNSAFNSGRVAGDGIESDRYDEESGGTLGPKSRAYGRVRFPHDGEKPEDLNGPCIIIQQGRKKE